MVEFLEKNVFGKKCLTWVTKCYLCLIVSLVFTSKVKKMSAVRWFTVMQHFSFKISIFQ